MTCIKVRPDIHFTHAELILMSTVLQKFTSRVSLISRTIIIVMIYLFSIFESTEGKFFSRSFSFSAWKLNSPDQKIKMKSIRESKSNCYTCFKHSIVKVCLVLFNSNDRLSSSLQPVEPEKIWNNTDSFEAWTGGGTEVHSVWATRLDSGWAAVTNLDTNISLWEMNILGRSCRSHGPTQK